MYLIKLNEMQKIEFDELGDRKVVGYIRIAGQLFLLTQDNLLVIHVPPTFDTSGLHQISLTTKRPKLRITPWELSQLPILDSDIAFEAVFARNATIVGKVKTSHMTGCKVNQGVTYHAIILWYDSYFISPVAGKLAQLDMPQLIIKR